ncbi:DedA family protein [Aliiroseovarius sp. M344]|uniref:DedA family protein n=1 Tax=Aliiroseovarius sp. M344 TaxID=2867010 RepID=UPI0021AD85DC|nr:DedA family protein [Aliiroseovarius sp. M344]UWQ15725.1 DedA family protein [Aliiroseovarius sp. M344]
MTDAVFALLSTYGPWVVFASAFLSCLAVPIPTSLMMLAGGAFAAAGDLALTNVVSAAFAGAVIGDQTGYSLGRYGGRDMLDRLARSPARKAVLTRAQGFTDRHGGKGVFLSTWAVAPLGPWVNFAAGATGLNWLRFTIWDILGETIWVTLYVGLGYGFAARIESLASLLGNLAGFLVAAVVAAGMFAWIRAVLRAQTRQNGANARVE